MGDVIARPKTFKELSEFTGKHYFPHSVTRESQALVASCSLVSRDLGEVSVVKLNWGAAVSVETEHAGAFAVNVPLKGRLRVRSASGAAQAGVGRAVLCPPGTPVEFPGWGAEVAMLGVRVGADYLRNQLEMVGATLENSPQIIDLSGGAGTQWVNIASSAVGAVDGAGAGGPTLTDHPAFRRNLAAALASGLALVLADNAPEGPRATPARLRRAVEALEADPARPWTVGEIAAVTGCGVRTLQNDFREEFGVGPVEYLRGIRLSVIHDELAEADPASGATVTEVALTWGITHLGRFATAYRHRYGETPSETLRSLPR